MNKSVMLICLGVCVGSFAATSVFAETIDGHLTSFWDELESWQEQKQTVQSESDTVESQQSGLYHFGDQQQSVPAFELYPNNYSLEDDIHRLLPFSAARNRYTTAPIPDALNSNERDLFLSLPQQDGTPREYGVVTDPNLTNVTSKQVQADIFHIINETGQALFQQGIAQAELSKHQNRLAEYLNLKQIAGGAFHQYESARKLLCIEMAFQIEVNGNSKAATLEEAFEFCRSEQNFVDYLEVARNGGSAVSRWIQDAAQHFPYDMNSAWYIITSHHKLQSGAEYGLPEWLMTITGTVIISPPLNGNPPRMLSIPGTGVTDNVMDRLIFGKQSAQYLLECDETNKCLLPKVNITRQSEPIAENSFFSQTDEALRKLVEQDPSQRENNANFVNRSYLPVLKIMTVFNALPQAQRQRERRELAEIMATEYALDYLENILTLVKQHTQRQMLADLQIIQNWADELDGYLNQVSERRQQNYYRLTSGLQYIQHLQNREDRPRLFTGNSEDAVQELLNRSLPALFAQN